jgi:hypothetical protein
MDELWLEVTSFTDIAHWRWRLTDTHGAFKADHQVALNQADPAYDAFTNLYDYLRYHAAPDRRPCSPNTRGSNPAGSVNIRLSMSLLFCKM